MPQMVCYEGNEDGFWLLWIVAAVGFCAFAIFVPAVLAEILYKANKRGDSMVPWYRYATNKDIQSHQGKKGGSRKEKVLRSKDRIELLNFD